MSLPEPAQVTLRPAVADDAVCLGVLGIQVFLDTYATQGIRPALAREVLGAFSTDVWDALLADARTRVLLAERAQHLVGFAQVTLGVGHALAPAGPSAELTRLYVQERFAGQGIGTALLAAAEDCAREAGAAVVWLTPWAHNQRALAFYARRGYRDCGTTWFRFEDEAHENRVLARRIGVAAAS